MTDRHESERCGVRKLAHKELSGIARAPRQAGNA